MQLTCVNNTIAPARISRRAAISMEFHPLIQVISPRRPGALEVIFSHIPSQA